MFAPTNEDKTTNSASVGRDEQSNAVAQGPDCKSGSPLNSSTNVGPSDGLGFKRPTATIGTMQQQQPSANLASSTMPFLCQPQSALASNFAQSLQNPQILQSTQATSNNNNNNNNFNQLLMALNFMGMPIPTCNQLPLQNLVGLNPGILNAMAAGAAQQQQLQLLQKQQQQQQQQQRSTSVPPNNSFAPQGSNPKITTPSPMGLASVGGGTSGPEVASILSSPYLNLAGVGMNPAAFQLMQGMNIRNFQQTQQQPTTSQPIPSGQQQQLLDCQVQSQVPQATTQVSSSSITSATQQSSSSSSTVKEENPSPLVVHAKVDGNSAPESLSCTDSKDENSSSSLPKTIILPCRARGMPLDHNFRSAHFVIPRNVRHGEDLMCSYEKCRDSGSKFRYCAECRIPVAKRNFHQRHGHGLVCVNTNDTAAAQAAPNVLNRTSNPTSDNDGAHPVAMASKSGKSEVAPPVLPGATRPTDAKKRKQQQRLESSQSTDANSSSSPSMNNAQTKRRKAATAAAAGTRAASGSDAGPEFPHFEDIPLSRQLRWATLLGKRPNADDADGMSAWLLEVMTVSDLKHPLGIGRNMAGSSSLTSSTRSRDSVMFGDSNNDSSAPMGSSVNSSLSTDILTSDVSSEEAAQDRRRDSEETAAESVVLQKVVQSKKLSRSSAVQESSKKKVFDAFRRQEKKRKNQKNKERRDSTNRNTSSSNNKPKEQRCVSRDKHPNKGGVTKKDSDNIEKRKQAEADRRTQEDLSNDSPDNENLSSSYAEWQERKKQKALKNHTADTAPAHAAA